MTYLVYDFGMNNGDDVDYYLKKGHDVVAVEANEKLCDLCYERFRSAISAKRLTILNVALLDCLFEDQVSFYVHKTNHVLSQLSPPESASRNDFELVNVRGRTASSIIGEYGEPYYIKVDVEGMDAAILKDVFSAGYRPKFISAEAHSVDVFALFLTHGYLSFNLVDGASVEAMYGQAQVNTSDGVVDYMFKRHSAGPYGDDIKSPWLDGNSFLYHLASQSLGWKDIHASLVVQPTTLVAPRKTMSVREHLYDLIPSIERAVRWRLARFVSSRGN